MPINSETNLAPLNRHEFGGHVVLEGLKTFIFDKPKFNERRNVANN